MPWTPYFEKMAQCDVFVILVHCQYEKNGWQNRCKVNDKWWTKPINKGNIPILQKEYSDGQKLVDVNLPFIFAMARILGIDTNKIKLDFPTDKKGTDRIVEICQRYEATEYLTNPEATEKYLDSLKFEESGIKIIPFKAKNKKHIFEMFEQHGIDYTIRSLCS